ncbi:MAG TPA: hypothetical protein VMV33_09360 [Rhodocyclaceae bacterium]|nr:hypothetical protein [Rhodocyclaceae bacterium]
MPYYVYKIHPPLKTLELVGQHASFKEASSAVKALRAEASQAVAGITIKMIFADNELAAEDLLSQVRPPEPMVGDDY